MNIEEIKDKITEMEYLRDKIVQTHPIGKNLYKYELSFYTETVIQDLIDVTTQLVEENEALKHKVQNLEDNMKTIINSLNRWGHVKDIEKYLK